MNIDFCHPEFSAMEIVTWKCHLYESTNGRYKIILGRYLLTTLGLDLKFYENVIIGGDRPYKGCLTHMVDVSNYDIAYLTDKTVKREESFINYYFNECLESDSAISSTQRICRILDDKYEKANLNTVMAEQCQHTKSEESYRLLTLLRRSEDLFDSTLGMRNTTPVELELKDDEKTLFSRPYPVPGVHKTMFKKEVKILVILGVPKHENDHEWGAPYFA